MTIYLLAIGCRARLVVRTASASASLADPAPAGETGRSSSAAADWTRSWGSPSCCRPGWSWWRLVCPSRASYRRSWTRQRRRTRPTPGGPAGWRSPWLALGAGWAGRARGWRRARCSSWSSGGQSAEPRARRLRRSRHSPGRPSWTSWLGILLLLLTLLSGCYSRLLLPRTAGTCPRPPGRRATGWPGRTWRSGGTGRKGPGLRWGSKPEGRGSRTSAESLVSASVCTYSPGGRSCVELGFSWPRQWTAVSEFQSAFSTRIRAGGKFLSCASLGSLEQFYVVVFWTRPWTRSSVFLCAPFCLCQAKCWRGKLMSSKLQMIEETSGSWRTSPRERRTCLRSLRRTWSPARLLTCWTCCAWQTSTCWGHCWTYCCYRSQTLS